MGPRQGQQLEGKEQVCFSIAVVIRLEGVIIGHVQVVGSFSVSLLSFTFCLHLASRAGYLSGWVHSSKCASTFLVKKLLITKLG